MKEYADWKTSVLPLNLMGGTIRLMEYDGQDMILVSWPDGMQTDVGYIEDNDSYYITTTTDNTPESWNHPLAVIEVKNRADLPQTLQNEIFRCRS